MPIPLVIVQTAKESPPEYVVNKIKQACPDFRYEFYNDSQCIDFFVSHPHPEFPNIVNVFNRFHGAHKSDLFRYYYLYIKGGIYIDSDAMVYEDLKDTCENFDYFSVLSTVFEYTIFQGVIGSSPKNHILYMALKHCYETPPRDFEKSLLLFHQIYVLHFDDG